MGTKLSSLEWKIMEALWEKSPLSASEVHDELRETDDCHVKTVRSLLDRMIKKEAVTRKKKHGVWVFNPALDRDASLNKESRTFLQRFFRAQPVPLVAHLVKNDMLSNDELDELRALIDRHRNEQPGGQSDE